MENEIDPYLERLLHQSTFEKLNAKDQAFVSALMTPELFNQQHRLIQKTKDLYASAIETTPLNQTLHQRLSNELSKIAKKNVEVGGMNFNLGLDLTWLKNIPFRPIFYTTISVGFFILLIFYLSPFKYQSSALRTDKSKIDTTKVITTEDVTHQLMTLKIEEQDSNLVQIQTELATIGDIENSQNNSKLDEFNKEFLKYTTPEHNEVTDFLMNADFSKER